MIVESHLVDEDGTKDRFPVGMRVLAVDDCQFCLNVLEKMLRECQYHVTTTTRSIKALVLLRENKNKFDLVICDVNMPHMDGFKLLEILGLEMDLPVVMLTGNNDKELVMKGVMHGACDYLVKPPRIEVLQNIWQHVVRRKIDCKNKDKLSNEEKASNMVGEGGQGITSENNVDYNKMLCQKMKERNEEEEEDVKEINKEPSTQKKSSICWNVELHTKFVAAVNQLGGIDKAVPKRILDLMNVEGFTRENVSRHLQKYKLVAALGRSGPYVQSNNTTSIGQFNPIGRSSEFTVSSDFPDNRATVHNANNSLPNFRDDFSPLSEVFYSGWRNGI